VPTARGGGAMILVTGAAGFLGRHVRAALAAQGMATRGLDRRSGPAGADWVTGDLLDANACAAALAGVRGVIHLAALADLWIADKSLYDRINRDGAIGFAHAARAAGVERFLYVSSATTLVAGPRGALAAPILLDEGTHIDPADLLGPYPRAKRVAEIAIAGLKAPGFQPICVLPTLPIGPGDENLTPPSRMLLDLAHGRLPALMECWLNLCGVEDMARALALIATGTPQRDRYVLAGEDMLLSALAAQVAGMGYAPAPRGRVPYRLARGFAEVDEAVADHLSHRAPTAPLTGVRLAGRARRFSAAALDAEFGWRPAPIGRALTGFFAWAAAKGLLTPQPGRG